MIKVKQSHLFVLLTVLTVLLESCVPNGGSVDIDDDLKTKTSSGGTVVTPDTMYLTLIGPTTADLNTCSPFSVLLKRGSNSIVAEQDYRVLLSGAASGAFYSDAACTSVITEVDILEGSGAQNFYISNGSAEMMIVKARESLGGIGEASMFVNVQNSSGGGSSSAGPSNIVFNGPNAISTASCTPLALVLKSSSGVSANATSTVTLNLSGNASGAFYSDSACSSSATSASIASGSSHTIVYYENNVAENLILQAVDAGSSLSSGSHSLAVEVDTTKVATKLGITGSRNLSTSTCSNPYIVRTLNSTDGETTVSSDTTLDLTGAGSGTFYSDSGCSTSITQLTILNGTSSRAFYYRSNSASSPTFIVDDSGPLTPITLDINVTLTGVSVAETFTIAGPSAATAGSCSTAFTLKTVDNTGSETAVSSSTTVPLAGKGSGNFYSDSGCSSMITDVTFASGESLKQFYYSNDTVEALSFNFDDSGSLVAVSKSFSISANTVAALELTGASTQNINECQAYVVSSKDTHGNLANLTSSTTVNFSGVGNGQFYSDSGCTSVSSSTLMTSGQNQKIVYYKNAQQESLTLAVAASGLTGDTLSLNVQSLPASQVSLASVSNISAGDCEAVTVYLKDSFGSNVVASGGGETVNLALSGSGGLFSDSGCSSSISSTTITSGNSSQTFYYENTTVSSETITATHGSLTGNAQSFSIVANTLNKMTITGSSTIGAGACSAYTLNMLDTHDNAAAPSSNILIQLTGGAGQYYSDSGCSSTTSSLLVTSSENSKVFYYKSNVGETPTLATTNSNSLANASLGITVNVGIATTLDATLVTATTAGTCLPITVYSRDNLGNISNLGSNTTINLSDIGSGTFYSDSGCSSSVTTRTITSGTGQVSMYYRNDTAETSVLSFTGGGLTQYDHSLPVSALAPSKLVLQGSAAIDVGSCFGFTLSTLDSFDNSAPVSGLTIVNMTGTGSGSFYSDASCSSAITSVVFLSSEASKLIYFKDNTAESLTLNLDDSGSLTAATFALTTQSLPASNLELSGSGTITVNDCAAFTVSTYDALGNLVNVGSNLTVNLGAASVGGYFSDSGCSSSITTTTVSSGTSSSPTIYYQSGSPASSSLTVTATSFASDTDSLTISALTPSELDLLGPSSATVGDCVTMQILTKDSLGNESSLPENKTITLTAGSGGAFYGGSTCSLVKSTVAMSTGESSAVVYYKANSAASATLSIDDVATALDLTGATLAFTSTEVGSAGPPDSGLTPIKLGLTGVTSSIMGTCVGPFKAETLDTNNEVASVDSTTSVSLTESALTGSKFYSDSSCASEVTSVDIGLGQSSALFYIQLAEVGNASLNVNASGLISAQMTTNSFTGANIGLIDPPLLSEGFALADGVTVTDSFTVTLSNSGISQAANIVSGGSLTNGFSYTGGTFPGTGGTCASGSFLNPNETCTLKLSFTSTTLGAKTTTLAVDYLDGSATREIRQELKYVVSSKKYPIKMAYMESGRNNHSCLLFNDKTVSCWGNKGSQGYLGRGTSDTSGGVGQYDNARSRMQSLIRVPRLNNVKDLFVGQQNSCALKEDDTLVCWGAGSGGALGQGNTTNYGYTFDSFDNPLPIIDLGTGFTPVYVAIGDYSMCALSSSHKVKCWGQNSNGQLGLGDSAARGDNASEMGDNLPELNLGFIGAEHVEEITSGYRFSCVRSNLGNVKCWGYNNAGQLGYGDTTTRGTSTAQMGSSLQNINIGAGYKAIDIDAGNAHTCAVLQNSNFKRIVKCWGENANGQIGVGSTTDQTAPQEVSLGNEFDPVKVALGNNFSCALSNDRKVKCWGENGSYQLGNFSNTDYGASAGQMGENLPEAAIVSYGSQVTDIEASNSNVCVFLQNNTVKCWGAAALFGQNTTTSTQFGSFNASPELRLHRNQFALDLSMGTTHTCGKWIDGNISCWGGSGTNYSVLGDQVYGRHESSWEPLSFTSSELPIKSLSSGAYHQCVITQDDNIKCWGENGSYQLGLADTTDRNIPTLVPLTSGDVPTKLALGANATCMLLQNGTVKCWGDNGYGQLGIESTTTVSAATAATAVDLGTSHTSVTDLIAGSHSFCAILDTGDVKCWGRNDNYQLGLNNNDHQGDDASEMGDNLTALDFGVGPKVLFVDLGQRHGCAGLDNKTVACWGINSSGATGQGTTTGHTIEPATTVTSTENVTSVSSGYDFSCASFADGSAQCWGNNGQGQLGINSVTSQTTPQAVLTGGSYRHILKLESNSDGYSICALLEDSYISDQSKVIKCWGRSQYGQLGYGLEYYTARIHYSRTEVRSMREIGPVAGPVIPHVSLSDYISPGTYSYEVPNGVSRIRVNLWGAGGGGFNSSGTSRHTGSSGAHSFAVLDATPGVTHNITVGAGGRGGTYNNNTGVTGGDSAFDSIVAGGGRGATTSTPTLASAFGGDVDNDGYKLTHSYGGEGTPAPHGGYSYYTYSSSSTYYQRSGATVGAFPGGGGNYLYQGGAGYYNGGTGGSGRVLIEEVLPTILVDEAENTNSNIYSTPGVFIYTVPVGVTSIRVRMWGGGGAGGNASSTTYSCGGGSGGYVDHVMVVTPGQSYLLQIGAGGSNDGETSNTTNFTTAGHGGDTRMGFDDTVLIAGGGKSGSYQSTSSYACTGSVADDWAGGGSASGGVISTPGNRGGPGSNTNDGGDAPQGGAGGSRGTTTNGYDGLDGEAPGGGGGGAYSQSGLTTGGNGADGRIEITPL